MKKVFITMYMLLLLLPLLFVNRDKDAVTMQENRPLAAFPSLRINGKPNLEFTTRLDNYLNDRSGFRNQLISLNGLMQYHVFKRMEKGEQYRLGPDGEFNGVDGVVELYQHKNLLDEKELLEITGAFDTIDDYLQKRDCDFYYMMCYGKESIYPEYFPQSVLQYGNVSRTDQVIDALTEDTDVKVVGLKEAFTENKDKYEVYSKYGDPVHWTPRGAFIGYTELIRTINESGTEYPCLTEDDFDITITDQGMEYFGGVKRSNMSEDFVLKDSSRKAQYLEGEAIIKYPSVPEGKSYDYVNPESGNDTKALVVCNSFIINYHVREDIAQSFGETLLIWSDISPDAVHWIEEFDPDIVIFESAERFENYEGIKSLAEGLR